MGKAAKFKENAIPKKIVTDEEVGGSGGKVRGECGELLVDLIRINLDIHKQSNVGDSISVSKESDGLAVRTINGNLGYIAFHYEDEVKRCKYKKGLIFSLERKPIYAVVNLIK